MRISDLNRQITLQAPVRVPDGAGGSVTTWTTIATVWAKRTTMRSDEAIQAMQTSGTLIHNYIVRFRHDIKGSWRIVDEGKYMPLIAPPINVNGENRYLDVKVKESA